MTLRDQLIRDEGMRLRPYLDCCSKPWRECTCKDKGKLTIGTGRNLDDVGISMDENDLMLDNDIARAQSGVLAALPWAMTLDDARRGVLINIALNAGVQGLLKFKKMLAHAERSDWEHAADEIIDSKLAPLRRARLAEQMVTGQWT